MFSININYNSISTPLCDIGAKYDTYKSSNRTYAIGDRHSHSNTIFYDAIFKNHRDKELKILEIGLKDVNSLLMWEEYFKNSEIYGFDEVSKIRELRDKVNGKRIHLFSYEDRPQNIQYDLIIENIFESPFEQINFIKNNHNVLKPGGMYIIENVHDHEKIYNDELLDTLNEFFEDFYFINMTNDREHIIGINKLLVLVKKGTPIFDNKKKVTFITPSIRPENLLRLLQGINFDYVNEWRIAYDGKKIKENPHVFKEENNPKIIEEMVIGEGVNGNPQRNHILSTIKHKDTFIYFLDDDNEVHPDIYRILRIIDEGYMYTFNQYLFDDPRKVRKGDKFKLRYIDSSQILIDYRLCNYIGWVCDVYEADGAYICDNYRINKNKWVFIDNILSYTNSIQNRKI
jgi:hypothetical protein